MLNELIPLTEFQTAQPSNEGLLTVRSTNTESESNNNLLDTYGLNLIEMVLPNVIHQNLLPDSQLIIPNATINIPIENIPNVEFEALPPDSPLIAIAVPVEELPVIFYGQGTCFTNLDSNILITDKNELFLYLCDVLIRFDASPSYYQKEDYEALIRMLTGSLIYLYDEDSRADKTLSTTPFLGLALPTTNPIAYAIENNYKFPGVYFVQTAGTYTNFGITVDQADLALSIIMLIPNIIDGIFVDYRKEIYTIDTSSIISDRTYRHAQSLSSNTWTIQHNLGKFPSITISDSAGSVVEGEVQYVDLNNLIINFSAPFGGYADLN